MDECLTPDIATALALFDFAITHVKFVPEFRHRSEGVEDPEIIDWCHDNGMVWITQDKKAKKQHEARLKSLRISVLWVRGPGQDFSAWLQFKIVMRVIEEVHQLLQSAHGAMHFRAGVRGGHRPEVLWTQLPRDMPQPIPHKKR